MTSDPATISEVSAMRTYDVLNLGGGVQSSRILLGACRGELPLFDAAVFADTRWEPKAVYQNIDFLRGECERPAVREVLAAFGWTSTNAATCHLDALVRKGYLLHEPGVAHAYRLAGVRCVIEESEAGRRLRETMGGQT